jgi:hypothetical protein
MNENKFSNWLSAPFVVPAMIISLGIILSAVVGAFAFYNSRTLDNTLSVTGSAKQSVTADSVNWTFDISSRTIASQLETGYSNMAKDLTAVKNFLDQNGIKEEQITITPIYMDEVYKSSNDQGPREVNLRQVITVQSSDVQGVTQLSKTTEILAKSGVFLSTRSLEYYYSKLADLRVSLLSSAIKDAKARAEEIAKAGGQSVGSLKAASSGVVQVLAPNSIEVSDYGTYDTSSIEKDIMVTARAVFFVD